MEGGNMFWGLVVKPGKRYESVVANAFRLTKACLEPSTAGGKVSSIMVECDTGENFILANLNLKTFSENLNVAFNEGEKICFKVEGPGTVHLSGNLAPDQEENMPSMMMDDSSDDEDISQLEDIAFEAKRIRDGIKLLPPGGVSDKSSESEEEDEDSDEEEEEDDDDNEEEEEDEEEEESSDDDDEEEEEEESEEKKIAPDENKAGKRKLEAEGASAKKAKIESDDDEDEDSEDEDSEEDDSEEDGGDELPNFDDIDTKDLTEAQKKKLEMVKKMFAAAQGKVAKEADTFEKNKAANAKKKVGDVNDNVKQKEVQSKEKPGKDKQKTISKDASIAAVTKEALAKKQKDEKAAALAKTKADPSQPKQWTLKGGVTIEELKTGTGKEAKKGNFVGMYYSGKVQGRKKTFDTCLSGKPFRFRLGGGQVISGWERGIPGMKEGGKRRLTLAPNMGYGAGGAPPDIPGNATLVFDIECKYVKLHASQETLAIRMTGEKVPDKDIHISLEDQQKINKFARQNQKLEDIKDDIKARQNEIVTLTDAATDVEELALTMEDDEKVPYLVGEIFVLEAPDVVQTMLEKRKADTENEVTALENRAAGIKAIMTDLKTHLYAKFGDAINLEADD